MESERPTTWLLAWNPKLYSEKKVAKDIAQLTKGKGATFSWNCARTKSIADGDRAFMIRLGVEPRGLVGVGWVVGEFFEGPHWSRVGTTNYIEVKWESFGLLPTIPMERLEQPPFRGFKWSTQSSGIRIRPDLVGPLEELWSEALGTAPVVVRPGRVPDESMSEGAALRTVADRYERSPTARNACISHYGTACAVCGFEFGKTYGKVGEGLVVVHHLVPLGVTRAQHETVPIVDLRPVCANCHLVIHREDPPLSIEAVKAQLVGNR